MQLSDEINIKLECKNIYSKINDQSVYEEFTDPNIKSKSKVLSYCYCYKNLLSHGLEATRDNQITYNNKVIYPCKSWLTSWIKSVLLYAAISICVPFINVILAFIMRGNITIILYLFI
jgi:hypothetical protein